MGIWHDAQRSHWQLVVAPYITYVDDYIDATPCSTMMCNAAKSGIDEGFPALK